MTASLLIVLLLCWIALIQSFRGPVLRAKHSLYSSKRYAIPSFILSDLDADTMGALGDIQELNQALDGAIDSANPAVDILTRLVASPAILAVPIGAGVLVAVALGFFISSYSQGNDD